MYHIFIEIETKKNVTKLKKNNKKNKLKQKKKKDVLSTHISLLLTFTTEKYLDYFWYVWFQKSPFWKAEMIDFVENLSDSKTDKSLGSAKPSSISGVNPFYINDILR